MSCLVGQPLADDAGQNVIGPRVIVHAKSNTMIVPEIKFRKVPVQVLLGAMLISTAHATLEDREIAFDGIAVHVAAHIFAARMLDGFVLGDLIF